MSPQTQDLQRKLERALATLAGMHEEGMLPPVLTPLLNLAPARGMRAQVTLSKPDQGWNPRDGEIRIRFAPAMNAGDDRMPDALGALIDVLDEAERNPTLSFVALKFLRDRLLPQAHPSWARSPQACQHAIAAGIDRGVLYTDKKDNPRNPEFPVTSVVLNRDHELVRERLGVEHESGNANGNGNGNHRIEDRADAVARAD